MRYSEMYEIRCDMFCVNYTNTSTYTRDLSVAVTNMPFEEEVYAEMIIKSLFRMRDNIRLMCLASVRGDGGRKRVSRVVRKSASGDFNAGNWVVTIEFIRVLVFRMESFEIMYPVE